jgi:hypothetical protein
MCRGLGKLSPLSTILVAPLRPTLPTQRPTLSQTQFDTILTLSSTVIFFI